MIGRFCGQILMVEWFFMLIPLIISIYIKEIMAIIGFAAAIAITAGASALLMFLCRGARSAFYAREGMICVGITWTAVIVFGSLPFFISGEIPSLIDALFETTSGFTTTGCSVVPNAEELSMGILFWRSFTHWLGGMGILVFLLAIAPFSKGSGYTMHLMRAESPGPSFGKLVPKLKQTASILYLIYIALTLIDIFFLLLGHMPVFDAVTLAFSTAGTGGFTVRSDSVAGFGPYIQYVTMIFMIIFGVNFNCYYMLLIKEFRSVLKDEEIRLYLGIVAAAILMTTIANRFRFDTVEESFRVSGFTVASLITSTGFSVVDYDVWSSFPKAVLICVCLTGACAGSTAGGVKCARILILFKTLRRSVRQVLNPQRVQVIKVNGRTIDENTVSNTSAFITAHIIILVLSFVIVSLDAKTIFSAFTATLACLNNIGLGFEYAGPLYNFHDYSILSKLVFCFNMIVGRLEIFPVLMFFSRSTWKHR